MKKTFLFFLLILITITLHAQSKKSESKDIVIYTQPEKNISLFFDSPIIQGTVGNQDFRFGYNKETPTKIGIVKGSTGARESNLLVITADKNIYSFILRESSNKVTLNYFINSKSAIGNVDGDVQVGNVPNDINDYVFKNDVPETELQEMLYNNDTLVVDYKEVTPEKSELYLNDRLEFMEKMSRAQMQSESFYKRYFAEDNGVFLKLNRIHYNKNELYLVLTIDNTSGVDYEVDYINFFVAFKKALKRRAGQKDYKQPIYAYQYAKRVEGVSSETMAFVFNKFSIDIKKDFYIELKEKRGERNVLLKVNARDINNPI